MLTDPVGGPILYMIDFCIVKRARPYQGAGRQEVVLISLVTIQLHFAVQYLERIYKSKYGNKNLEFYILTQNIKQLYFVNRTKL